MEELNEQQRNEILRKRQEMLKKMGVSNGGKMMNESVVSTHPGAAGTASRIAAIRNGAAKAELSKYVNASSKAANGGFEGIPEPKAKKPNQEVKAEYKQELTKFSGPQVSNSSELDSIEAMFDGGGRMSMSSMGGGMNVAPQSQSQELDFESVNSNMPSFNPQAALQKKVSEKTGNQPQSQYLKYSTQVPPVANEQFIDVGAVNQPQINTAQLQIMMETIAKGIAEKTIRSVLNEYSEQQKSKLFFEYYNKEKGIIKTPDGKYYRLTQVELKKKV